MRLSRRIRNSVLLLSISIISSWPILSSAQPTGVLSSKSHSGQFIMVAAPVPRVDRMLLNTPGMVELEPTLLPISCERVKQRINHELQTGPAWASKIFLDLHPALPGEPGITVASERYSNAWQYRLSLPNPVDRTLFVKSIVQVVLMEMANRGNTTSTSAEIPTWLIEGFTRHILALCEAELILSPSAPGKNGIAITPTVVDDKEAPLKAAHAVLRASGPLSFETLSWPAPEHLMGPQAPAYGASAHLFLNRIFMMPNGRERLRQMIFSLPSNQNWQFAFFASFSPEFQKALDVEKWWTLQYVHFTGREIWQSWPLEESRQKLAEALKIPVNIHRDTNSLPSQSEITLQAALRQWEPRDQRKLMESKVRELEMLRLRVATNLIATVEDYRLTLCDWLHDDTRGPVIFGLGRKAAQARAAAHTAHRLDLLDKRLLALESGK